MVSERDVDEPSLRQPAAQAPAPEDVAARVEALLRESAYAVLCTQAEGQAYGSLMAVALEPDLRRLYFATPTTTRKFANLSASRDVALVFDDRYQAPPPSQEPGLDLQDLSALTIQGRARRLEGPERAEAAAALEARHPALAAFLEAPSCALFAVEVARGFFVTRFQEVAEWRP